MKIRVGETIKGFKIISVDRLPQLNNTMVQLEHVKTGAKMIHLENEDDNNCFSIGFKTTPTDSTGVAHILEHTVLCGSEKYPVRDPFFSMIKRSMKTFMNAMTANDWTMYPFATQNEKDYFNLMDVYLDAVFFPLLTNISFMQEGHRLEFREEGNINSDLLVQGIVYSEMMGAMSSQSHVMHRSMGEALYPTTTYRYNSGGDPEEIMNLTHQQLLDFHKYYYHPSNSFIYTYGNIPLEKKLEPINRMLDRFEKLDVSTEVPEEKRYSEPQRFTYHYPLSEMENDEAKCQVAVGWLTCKITEPLEILSLQLINLILLGHSGAPLRKVLLESKMGKSLADTTGFDDEFKEPFFSAGLQGVKEKNLAAVESLVHETLAKIVQEGIKTDQLESAIHQMEMDTKEISGGHYPYSLNLIFRFFGTWIHGGDPVSAIDFDKNLAIIKEKVKDGNYLENQIKKYLIDNPHSVSLHLKPDIELEAKRAQVLKTRLENIRSSLTEQQKEALVETSNSLKTQQETKEDISCLPSLQVSDIPNDVRYLAPYKTEEIEHGKVVFYDRPTNGIFYISCHFDITAVDEQDRMLLPLAGYMLTNNGADGLDYEALSKLINRYTGGFSAAPSIEINTDPAKGYQQFFTFSSKALYQNIGKMLEIGTKIINRWNFSDLSRVQTLIGQRTNSLVNSIVQAGHTYASSLASRDLSPTNQIEESWAGVHQIRFMKDIAQKDESAITQLTGNLDRILGSLIDRGNVSVVVIGEKEILDRVSQPLAEFISTLPEKGATDKPAGFNAASATQLKSFKPTFHHEAWTTTTPVSYVAKSFKTPTYTHDDCPVLLVLANLLRSNFLHNEIREKGGAYGGMASYNADEGIFTLMSYRDPHLARTIGIYEQTLDWLKAAKFDDQDVSETILQTCSNIDTPLSPAGKAMVEYLAARKGKTKSMREKFRSGILNCRKEDLIRVGRSYLETTPSLVAVTSNEILKRDEENLKQNPLNINKI